MSSITLIPTDVLEALEAYIANGEPVGRFLNAVLANDLREAMYSASGAQIAALPAILQWLQVNAPDHSWGSEALYRRWLYEHPARAKGPFEVV